MVVRQHTEGVIKRRDEPEERIPQRRHYSLGRYKAGPCQLTDRRSGNQTAIKMDPPCNKEPMKVTDKRREVRKTRCAKDFSSIYSHLRKKQKSTLRGSFFYFINFKIRPSPLSFKKHL